MQPVVFFDNDAILKLVACDLFSEAIGSLGLSEADLRVLPDAKYVFRKNKQVLGKHPQAIIDNAILIVDRCPKISLVAPREELFQCENYANTEQVAWL